MSDQRRDLSLIFSMSVKYGPNCLIGKVNYRSKIIVLGSHLLQVTMMYICVNVMELDMQSRSWDYTQQVGIKPTCVKWITLNKQVAIG